MKHTRFWKFALIAVGLALLFSLYSGYMWLAADSAKEAALPRSRTFLSIAGIGSLIAAIWWQFKRHISSQNEINAQSRVTLVIEPSGRDEYQSSTFWHDLVGQIERNGNKPSDHIGLDIIANQGVIRFYIHIKAEETQLKIISSEIRKVWPKTHIEIVESEPLQEAERIAWYELVLERDDKYPISLPNRKDFTVARNALHRDQIADYLAALSSVKKGVAGVQILVRPAPEAGRDKWTRDATTMRRKLQTKSTHVREYSHSQSRKTFGAHNADELKRDVQTLSERLDSILLETSVRIWSDITDGDVASQIAGQIVAASAGGRNSFKAKKLKEEAEPQLKQRRFSNWGGSILTSDELDRMIHIPGEATCQQFPMIATAGAERLPAVKEIVVPQTQTLCTEQGLSIGRYRPTVARSTTHRAYGMGTSTTAERVIVGQPFVAAREHCFIFGPTGTGKSTLAENLLLQDWLAGENHSVLVIDPHGELIHSVLRCIPRSREADVVIINPNDIQPPRVNVLNINQGQEAIDKAIAHMLEGFKYAMGASWTTSVGMQDVLLQGMAMIKSIDPDASMCELEDFLGLVSQAGKDNDEARKQRLYEYSQTPLDVAGERALKYWQKEFMALNPQARAQSAGAAKRRVKAFLNSDAIRSTMGMKGSTVNLDEAVNSGKLILVVMAEGMGEVDRKIWGALLVREFISILKRRSRAQREHHASIVIDEMASTIGTMKEFVKEIGAELRKFGGSATLITQSYSQIPEDTIKEMKANYRTQVAFSGSPDDARIASGLFQEKVSPEDIQALPPYHAYFLGSIKGAQAPPCLIQCFPPAATLSEPKSQEWPFHPTWSYVLGKSETFRGKLDDLLLLKQLEIYVARHPRGKVMELVDEILKADFSGWENLQRIYALKKQFDRWQHQALLDRPGIVTNTVERVTLLSRLDTGIPFWWSLAEYRFLYLNTKKVKPGKEQPIRARIPRKSTPDGQARRPKKATSFQ